MAERCTGAITTPVTKNGGAPGVAMAAGAV